MSAIRKRGRHHATSGGAMATRNSSSDDALSPGSYSSCTTPFPADSINYAMAPLFTYASPSHVPTSAIPWLPGMPALISPCASPCPLLRCLAFQIALISLPPFPNLTRSPPGELTPRVTLLHRNSSHARRYQRTHRHRRRLHMSCNQKPGSAFPRAPYQCCCRIEMCSRAASWRGFKATASYRH